MSINSYYVSSQCVFVTSCDRPLISTR